MRAEQEGLAHVRIPAFMRDVLAEFRLAHVEAYQLVFCVAGLIAIAGAVVCFRMVRREDRIRPHRTFSRRSRWAWATTGQGPSVTRKLPPTTEPLQTD